MDPQLEAVVRDLQDMEQRLRTLRASATSEAWSRRPDAARWSAAECVAHLNLTSEALLPLLRAGIEGTRQSSRPTVPYRRGLVGWLIWKLIVPSNGLRTRTGAAFIPSGEQLPNAIVADFMRLQSEIIATVRAADGLSIDQVTVVSPFNAMVKCNLYAALTLVPRHQHRHLVQAEGALGVERAVVAPEESVLAL